jgi:hypothetical protein
MIKAIYSKTNHTICGVIFLDFKGMARKFMEATNPMFRAGQGVKSSPSGGGQLAQ